MVAQVRQKILIGSVVVTLALLAACGPKAPPAPAPPPPRPAPIPVVYIPPRPQPPLGAPAGLAVPRIGADGVRQTVNANITPTQATWNFRSAYNVAALNCLKPQHADILIGYRAFLKTHARGLTSANRGVDADFRKRYGTSFIRPREAYMTQVYNYFAYPPTLAAFCDATLAVSRESVAVKPVDLASFSALGLGRLELVFNQFYRSYDQYRADAGLWDAKYAPVTVTTPVATNAVPSVK